MKKQLRFILLLTIFLLPLLSATPGPGYEEIKVLFFIIFIFLAALLWLFDYFRNPQQNNFKFSKIGITSALFVASLTITSLFGIDPLGSLIGTEPYFQGLVLYGFLFLFSFFRF